MLVVAHLQCLNLILLIATEKHQEIRLGARVAEIWIFPCALIKHFLLLASPHTRVRVRIRCTNFASLFRCSNS